MRTIRSASGRFRIDVSRTFIFVTIIYIVGCPAISVVIHVVNVVSILIMAYIRIMSNV